MRSLVELVVNNQKSVLNENKEFNLSSSESVLINQLRGKFPYNFVDNDSIPITVEEKPSWNVIVNNNVTFLNKKYFFTTTKHLLYFINEAISLSKKYEHSPEMILKENTIEVNLFTQDIFDVTDIDKYLSKQFDEIYEEIKIVYKREE